MRKIIPIFYAIDDAFLKYSIVSIKSLIAHTSDENQYDIYILNTNINFINKDKVLKLQKENVKIEFVDVNPYLSSINDKLPIRDYYSKTTYFRFFIAEMFPNLNKAIYIDADTIILNDLAFLYNIDIEGSYLGACHEQVMIQVDTFGEYVEKVIGVSRYNYFNAGLMLINCEEFRTHFVLDKFIHYLHTYNFVVTQDEDYLNLICKDHVYWLDQKWNTEIFGTIPHPIEDSYVLHYIMSSKPWHYVDCRYNEYFWKYAKDTSVYKDILKTLSNYSEANKEKDRIASINLVNLAKSEIEREDNFLNTLNETSRAKDRVAILNKINQYEREGRFDEDVELDPPSKELLPNEIDYLRHTFSQKMKTKFAYMMARKFLNKIIDEKQMIVKDIIGIENFKNLNSGAVITCNHFNAFDSFAIQMAYEASEQKNRKFYRVIREGNYTSFPGFYGFLMRHCNTLPLSSNRETMKKFLKAIDALLKEGNFILVYPEQSLWWNYRKPKPLKKGAFQFASKNKVPVLPCFITMKDSDIMGPDGFYVQEYTIHISKPIYPSKDLNLGQNVDMMLKKNYEEWKNIYEQEYKIPLTYETIKEEK